jgi:hypothetical protein
MHASEYLRENRCYSIDDHDLDKDVSDVFEVSRYHRCVQDPNVELESDDDEDTSVGVGKVNWKANKRAYDVNAEDYKVDQGEHEVEDYPDEDNNRIVYGDIDLNDLIGDDDE